MNYSVAIVDDQKLFGYILERLVSTFENFHVLYHAKSGEAFIDKLKEKENVPDVVLLDINMPGMGGVETMHWIKKNRPEIKVLALTSNEDKKTIVEMLRAGAAGYLTKNVGPETLKDSLDEVMRKGFSYSDTIKSVLINYIPSSSDSSEVILKDREIEFLRQVCTEKTYKEIASEMFLSPKTIDGYREALFEKLRIKSRIGLAIYAIKNKLYKVE
jgi:DNA-binding NarL/FixJ family response regulator